MKTVVQEYHLYQIDHLTGGILILVESDAYWGRSLRRLRTNNLGRNGIHGFTWNHYGGGKVRAGTPLTRAEYFRWTRLTLFVCTGDGNP